MVVVTLNFNMTENVPAPGDTFYTKSSDVPGGLILMQALAILKVSWKNGQHDNPIGLQVIMAANILPDQADGTNIISGEE